jgi:hypothetical protein
VSRKVSPAPVPPTENTLNYPKIAEAIGKVSEMALALNRSGLSREAVTVLIKHRTGLSLAVIRTVLLAAEDLRTWCLKQ